jgi:1-acyl-sn-glycerol-3-phosphate acyltransferase
MSVRAPFLFLASMLLMTAATLVMLLAQLVTLFHARRFCAEVVGKTLGRTVLRLGGVRLVVHQNRPFPEGQAIYVANHSSTIDLFILIALGLPNTRFFMKRKYLLFGPLGGMAWLTGTFFTPPQSMPEKRARCFHNAEKTLRRTGESAFLSPEGTRVTTGEIGPFNKGTFHLATRLKAPIVPLFIDIPPEVNPGRGFGALPGTIEVHVHAPIPTDDWRLEDLEQNKKAVRDRFVGYLKAARARRHAPAEALSA